MASIPVLTGLHGLALGFVHTLHGDRKAAASHLRKALALFEAGGYESLAHQALSDAADNAWAQGALDEAEKGFREAIKRLRGSPFEDTDIIGMPLSNLVGVLTEQGNFAEALAAARASVPTLLDANRLGIAYNGWSLRLARLGRYADAARAARRLDRGVRGFEALRARAQRATDVRERRGLAS